MHDASGVLLSFENGQPKTSQPMRGTHVASYDEFIAALHFNILPSLIEQPQVLLDWLTFARTVGELRRVFDWSTASTYIVQQLSDKVDLRARFGAADLEIISSIASAKLASLSCMASSSSSSSSTLSRSSVQSHTGDALRPTRPCVGFNFDADGCKFGASCTYKHDCKFRPRCKNANPHPSRLCECYDPDHPSNFKRVIVNDHSKSGGKSAYQSKPPSRR
jgi:hypothetical protein